MAGKFPSVLSANSPTLEAPKSERVDSSQVKSSRVDSSPFGQVRVASKFELARLVGRE